MCFHIIPLCPGCEEPSGLGEEVIYSNEICGGDCPSENVCGSNTRFMTQREMGHPGFECLTPCCGGEVRTVLSAAREEEELQRARDEAKRFLRETYEGCLSLCILPFIDEPVPTTELETTSEPPLHVVVSGFQPVNRPQPPVAHGKSRPWSKKRGQQWTREEEVSLWKLRRQGMEFDVIARQIDRTERGCYDRYNRLRNLGFGRQ